VPVLPQQINIVIACGGQWPQGYTLTNDDGTPMDLSTAVFELVIRPTVTDVTEPALVSVTSAASSNQGYITITGNVVLVVLSPTATALLGAGARPYALWLDPGLSDATPIVVGTCFSDLVAAA
jgi:hypothetical protein